MMKRYISFGPVIGVVIAVAVLALSVLILFSSSSDGNDGKRPQDAHSSAPLDEQLTKAAEQFVVNYYVYSPSLTLDAYGEGLRPYATESMVQLAMEAYTKRWKGIAPGTVVSAKLTRSTQNVHGQTAVFEVGVVLTVTQNDRSVELGDHLVTLSLQKEETWKVDAVTEH